MATLPDQRVQLPTQRLKINDLSIHLAEMFSGNDIDAFTRMLAVQGKVEQCAGLIEGKSEIPRAPDEAQSSKINRAIGPIVSGSTGRHRQQPDPLIPSYRLDLGVGRFCEGTNAQRYF